MKHLIQILLLTTFTCEAFAQIVVMDALEFSEIRHYQGRRRYVSELTEHLKALDVRDGEFIARDEKVDHHVVYELIQSQSRWKTIVAQIERKCADRQNRRTCLAMERSRLNIFDYIKKNPESVDQDPHAAAPSAAR